jgi:hypothetical protein
MEDNFYKFPLKVDHKFCILSVTLLYRAICTLHKLLGAGVLHIRQTLHRSIPMLVSASTGIHFTVLEKNSSVQYLHERKEYNPTLIALRVC